MCVCVRSLSRNLSEWLLEGQEDNLPESGFQHLSVSSRTYTRQCNLSSGYLSRHFTGNFSAPAILLLSDVQERSRTYNNRKYLPFIFFAFYRFIYFYLYAVAFVTPVCLLPLGKCVAIIRQKIPRQKTCVGHLPSTSGWIDLQHTASPLSYIY